mmetsp:Transcript_26373/g.59948  ORF Transcript_26373/g.59948 Transcript_26373/m.59948 type:complete len:287 (+) Transcript_26373:649-1509(+)
MHSHRSLLLLADSEELLDDGARRSSAVLELQVVVTDSHLLNLCSVVRLGLVQADDGRDALALEGSDALCRAEGCRVLLELPPHVRPAESDQLRADHVEVEARMVPPNVVLHVERVQAEPAELGRAEEASEAVEDGEVVLRRKVRGVAEGLERRGSDPLEGSIRVLWRKTSAKHDIGTEQERSVGDGGRVVLAVVDEVTLLETGLRHLLVHQHAKMVEGRKIDRTKVMAEGLITLLSLGGEEEELGLVLDLPLSLLVVFVHCEGESTWKDGKYLAHTPFLVESSPHR